MQLMTKEIERKLPSLRSTENLKPEQVDVVVKFFTPWSDWTWYAVEYNPDCKLFYGLVDGFDKEVGYWGLEELEEIKGPFGLKIERDRYFDPVPLRELM